MSSAPKAYNAHSSLAELILSLKFSTSWLFLRSGTRYALSAPPIRIAANISQFLVCVFASLGSVLYGYDLGVIAEVIASQSFAAKFGNNENEQ